MCNRGEAVERALKRARILTVTGRKRAGGEGEPVATSEPAAAVKPRPPAGRGNLHAAATGSDGRGLGRTD